MFIFYLQPIEQPVRTNQTPRQIPYQVNTIMDSEEYSVPQEVYNPGGSIPQF